MTVEELKQQRRAWLDRNVPYKLRYYKRFKYEILSNIMYVKRAGSGTHESYNDVIIMLDTETSKKPQKETIDYAEIYADAIAYIKKMRIKLDSDVRAVYSFRDLQSVGIKSSYKYTLAVDEAYEELRDAFPWIFKEDAYSKEDCIYYIYEFMDKYNHKQTEPENHDNHVVAWTISIRAFNRNIVTLYGHRPSECIECINLILQNLKGDRTMMFVHNLAYDWMFLRKFMIAEWGIPDKQLNTKAHYPVSIEFCNGLILRDSLILSQRSLDKWAKDMDVEHQKACGKWEYEKLRTQDDSFTDDEKEYIEHDTLAGVECIQKTLDALNKRLYAIPFTATGIPREETRKRGHEFRAHDAFKRMAPTYQQQLMLEQAFHGGYVHANRHYAGLIMEGLIEAYDFASSYPFIMLSCKVPMEAFHETDNCDAQFILENSEDYAYMFKLIMVHPRLKPGVVMPALQFSKCLKTINAVTDNGRVLEADYAEIRLTEQDLFIIMEQYDFDTHICTEVQFAMKDYLPRWFTDYVYELFKAKTELKGGDPVLYSLSKAKLNALYGMCSQRPVRENIVEDYETGEYNIEQEDPEEMYEKYLKKYTSILPYQWGVWVTAYAFKHVHMLGKCAGLWLYSDTDSCYGMDWDNEAVEAYNDRCRAMLKANGYEPVIYNGREYCPGVAELDGQYSEFVAIHAKCYCCRSINDGELHITVAGVPKEGVKVLNNDIRNFKAGTIFPGYVTGKLTHTYYYVDKIYTDNFGNETGDSIDLTECDYLMDSANSVNWEPLFTENIEIIDYEA